MSSNPYTQLTREERYHIWQMNKMGKSHREIGGQMSRSAYHDLLWTISAIQETMVIDYQQAH